MLYLEDELYAGPPWRSVLVTEVVTLVKERINNKIITCAQSHMEFFSTNHTRAAHLRILLTNRSFDQKILQF